MPISWHRVTLRRAVDTGRLIKFAHGTHVQGGHRTAAGERARHPGGQALGRRAHYRRLARDYVDETIALRAAISACGARISRSGV